MSRTRAGALVFLFAVPLLYAGTPHAQTAPLVKKEAGIVTSLSGRADIAHAATPQPVSLRTQDPVFGGDRIRSFEKSLVRVLLGGKALVTIRELSTFTLTEEPGHASVTLPRGKLALSVARLRMNPGESIEIRTPNAIAAVRGTVLIVQVEGPDTAFEEPIDLDKVSVTFTVLKGTVEIFRLNAALPPTTLRSFEEMKMAGEGKGEVREISAAEAAQLVEGFKSALPFTEGSGSDGGTSIAKREMAKALALAKFLAPDSVSEQTIEGEADQQLPTSTDGDAQLASASLPLADATNGTAAASTLVPILDSGPQQSQTQTPLPGSLTETTGSQVFLGSNFGGDGGPLVIPPDQTINTNQTFTTATHTSGTLSGTGIVTTTGLYTWSGGTMSGTGNTVANGGLALGGAGSTQTLDQRTLVVNNATLTNSGTFTASNGADILGTNSTLTNTGTFNVTGTGTSTIVAALNNSGTLDVQSGTLNLTGGGTDTGSVTVASDATLQFGGGTHNLNAGTDLMGNGTVQMSAGSVNVNTDGVDRLTGALSVTGGTLTVNGDLASLTTGQSLNPTANAFNFTGGEVTVTGATSDLVDVAGGTMSLTGSLLTKSGAGALSVGENLVNITAGGKLTGTGSVPLAQFTGGTVSVGTAGEGHGSLFIVDGDGSSMALAGTLLNSANTTVQLGVDLLQVHNGASFSSQSTNPLIEFTGGSLEADGFLFNSSAATVGGSLFKATNMVLTQPRGQPLPYVELVGATLNVGRSVLELTNSSLNLTGAPGDQPVILLQNGSTLGNTTGPWIAMTGGTLQASSLVTTIGPGPHVLDIQGSLLDASSANVTTTGIAIDLDSATLTQTNASLIKIAAGNVSVGGGIRAINSTLSVNQTAPLFDLQAGASLTSTGPTLDLTDISLNLGSQPFESMTGASHITSTGPVFKVTDGSFTAGTLTAMDGTGNSINRTGTLLDLTNTTVALRSITDFSGTDSISITLSPGQANVRMTDSNMTLTGAAEDLSVLGGLNVAPATHAGVALIATDTVGAPDHAITLAGALARFVNGVTLTDPGAQVQLNNMTVNTTGTASLIEVGVGAPTSVSVAGSLLQATSTVFNQARGTSLLRLLPSSSLTVGGHLFDLTGTNVDLTPLSENPRQPLVTLAGNNTLTLNGSFLKMNGGTLTASGYLTGDVTNTVQIASTSPFIDLTNAHVQLTGANVFGTVNTITSTLADGVPVVKLDNSVLDGEAPDLCFCTFGPSSGALALVMTNGSTLTKTGTHVDLVDFTGASATATATAPLIQMANSTLSINNISPYAMVHTDANTIGHFNGPLVTTTDSVIFLNANTNLLWVEPHGSLTGPGVGTGAAFQFNGGSSLFSAVSSNTNAIVIDPFATLSLNTALVEATNTSLTFSLSLLASGGTITGTSTAPWINLTGGSLTVGQNSAIELFPGSSMSIAGPLLKATNTVFTPSTAAPFLSISGALLGPVASLTVGGPVLDLANSNLDIGGQPLIKLTGGSSFVNTTGPLIRMNGGTLSADSLIITDSTFNSFSTTGPLMDLTNATVTMRVIGDEQATSVFVDSFSFSLGVNEPLLRLNGSTLTFTQPNQDGLDLSPNGSAIGIQSGVTLIATNGSTFTTGSALLSLENITYTDSNPQIQLSNSTLTTTGARNLIEAISSTPMVTGPLLTATDSTLNLSGGLLSVEPGAQLTTPTTSALVTLTGGTHTVATNTGAALFDVKGAPFTTQTVDGVVLELGTSPAVHGGTVAAPAALSASLLQTSGATVSTGTAVRVDTALLEATAPLIQALANSNVAVSGGAAFQVGTRATLRNSGSATSSVVFLDGSRFTANGGPLFNLTGVGGSYLHTVAGDLLFLTNGSVLDVTSLTNGFLISAAGSSVVDINGALVRFGTGTNGGNSVIVRNNVAPTNVIPGEGFNFPVVLTGGAQLSQITIQGTPVKNLAGNTITLTNSGSLFAIDGAGARITIRGN